MRTCTDGAVATTTDASAIEIHRLGERPYATTWQSMRTFTDQRNAQTTDQIWLLQHPPVFTQGQGGKEEHVIDAGDIPVIRSDRGGQVTYHGPGQIIVYTLIDLQRRHWSIRSMVSALEQSVIGLLETFQISAHARPDAPGVYVNDEKIAALGLRVRRGRCYHGLSLNVDMDLEPFQRINPCGYAGQKVTQLSDLCGPLDPDDIGQRLIEQLTDALQN